MSDDLKERVEQIMELKPSDDIHKMRIQAWKMACIIKELAEREVKLEMEVEDLKRTRQVAIDMAADKSNNCILAQEREAKLLQCVKFYANPESYDDTSPWDEKTGHCLDVLLPAAINIDCGKKAQDTLKELGVNDEC